MIGNPPEKVKYPNGIAYFGYTGHIDPGTVMRICGNINLALDLGAKAIHLTFSSHGGNSGDGVFLYSYFRGLPIPVTIHATGNIESIALIVYLGAETRISSCHTLFMAHPTAIPVQTADVNLEQSKALAKRTLAEEDRADSILRARCSAPEEVIALRRKGDFRFSPQDAVEFGIVHSLAEFKLPPESGMVHI